MRLRKLSLALAAAAFATGPGWAPAAAMSAGDGHSPHGSAGDGHGNAGAEHGHGRGHNGTHPGSSHRCQPHAVGYVASGTLEAQSLTKNADGTYSGSLSVDLTHGNRPARAGLGKQQVTVEDIRVTFGLRDANGDGSVGLDDLAAGDRVRLLGRITVLAKRCPAGEFTATTTIRHAVFHAPRP